MREIVNGIFYVMRAGEDRRYEACRACQGQEGTGDVSIARGLD
jgi:hypothetical protein